MTDTNGESSAPVHYAPGIPPAQTRDAIADPWGPRSPYTGEWPERVDERLTAVPERWVQSACVLCSTGCALDVGVAGERIVGVRGRGMDRVNRGRLGPKGLHGWEANAAGDRLTRPLLRQADGRLTPVSWDEAFAAFVDRSKAVIRDYTGAAIGIYNTGQLMLEEYYTLAVIGDAGIRTPHMDGNTRLCTATSATALIESFGTDGQPGTFADLDLADVTFHIGHNMAETQTVLWSRLLDRRVGANPPAMIVVDPRRTPTAGEADLHLAPRAGTNLALMNGLLHLIIAAGQIDRDFIDARTVGFDALVQAVASCTPAWTAGVTGIPEDDVRRAAEVLGGARRLVSTVLQGVYQSMHATATAVQVNNLHLIRGQIGKPGCTVFQMNGQPSAQNTRECGANGESTALRNWANPAHRADLARVWNVDPSTIPHANPPTHAMQIFRYCEEGSIRLLWIIGTNPAVSLPELGRIRQMLQRQNLFVVAQDAFLTETAALADLILPAALWGEKTGCITNADRTVHLLCRAVGSPGEARSDLAIFVEYARRMGFSDKDGAPLVKWRTPEEAFEAWKEASRGRPCDYSGLTYETLAAGSGIPWPCTTEFPTGRERLYTDGVFNTDPEVCETYGHDLATGAMLTREEYAARRPGGRAIIKAAEYVPPEEVPDRAYPLWLTTGRNLYHWHTRTKTGRVPALNAAAPAAYVEISAGDALSLGIAEGAPVIVESRRGSLRAAARVATIRSGHVFIPFHYGAWDDPGAPRAANELTLTSWDPVSKQPHFKYAAVRVRPA